MTSIIAPRVDQPFTDGQGRITRDWYKYLVLLGNSVGPSLTAIQDVELNAVMDNAGQSPVRALRKAETAEGLALLTYKPQRPPAPANVFTYWPWV